MVYSKYADINSNQFFATAVDTNLPKSQISVDSGSAYKLGGVLLGKQDLRVLMNFDLHVFAQQQKC